MKRSYALNLIANQLDFLNKKFEGSRSDFSKDELSNADVILATLESAGMMPPILPFDLVVKRMANDGVHAELHKWEDEGE